MVDVLQCGASNIRSVLNALAYLGIEARVVSTPEAVLESRKLIFPGVGHFGYVARTLDQNGVWSVLQKKLREDMPFLGICLGMQLLFESSEEAPGVAGLGILPGTVAKLPHPRTPQIGWNRVEPTGRSAMVRAGDAYFVNSFAPLETDTDVVTATTEYGGRFASAVQRGNVVGFQFHPEKSGPYGLQLLKEWCVGQESA